MPGDAGRVNPHSSKSRLGQSLALLVFVFNVCVVIGADDPPAGHSMHGDVFNEGPRQAAYLMNGTGRVHFPVTTRSAEAQKFFDQGIGQLHGFWYFEAERSFRQVSALDPDCAMAYWGMAMANVNNTKRARGFIEKAVELKAKAKASPREQAWIDALAGFRKDDKRSEKDRRTTYLAALASIAKAHPDDLEAKAFWAVAQWESSSKGVPIKDKEALNRLLQDIFDRNPQHPAHHYRIHLWDESRATNALASAAANGASSPATAHMWHMSGHTYSKLHRYSDAAWQQEASARTDHAYMMKNRVVPDQIHNFAHNNEWLIRDLNHIGAVRDAIDLAKNMIELPRHPTYNTLTKGSANYGHQRLIETLVRYELWDELLALSHTTYLEPVDDIAHDTRRARALGLAHFHNGDLENGKVRIKELTALKKKDDARKAEEAKRKATQKAPEKKDEGSASEKSGNETRSAPASGKADSSKSGRKAGKAPTAPSSSPIENALAELEGWLAVKEGDSKRARERFSKSMDLPKERLAQIEFLLGDQAKALKLAQDAARSATNQVQPLASYVDLAYRTGHYREAYTNFFRLRDIAAEVDLTAPVFQRLAPVAKELSYASDWRPRLQRSFDFGRRPSLEKLGPFRWQPMPAEGWTLPDSEGRKLALNRFRGRPVVVIFFLGHGCGHCIQQLNAFAPVVRQFDDAGISLVAVSTDSVEGIKETFTKTDVKEKFPFPVVSDERLRVFKAYRCYDDFEKMPLHGTFLIDGNGLVRWQDISFQPFMETQFLLGEAKRLLGRTRSPLMAGGQE